MLRKNKAKLVGITLLVLITLVATFCVTAAPALTTVNVAYHSNLHGASPIVIGLEKKFFEQYGIKLNPIKFLSGPPELQAMAAGDLDFGYLGSGATFIVAQGLAKILTIDNLSYTDSVIVRKNSHIKSVKDLKGKTVAVPKGTTGEQLLVIALEKAGVKSSDVKMVNMDVAGAVAAFVAGKVEAVAIWAPYTFEIAKQVGKNNITYLTTYRDYPGFVYPSCWLVRPDLLQKNPDLVVRFMKGWIKANDYRKKHLDETVKLTADFIQAPVDQLEQMAELTDFYYAKDLNKMLKDGTIDKMYDGLVKSFVKNEKLSKYVDPKTFVIPGPFEEAMKTLDK